MRQQSLHLDSNIIHVIFEEQVNRTPNHTALVCDYEEISYQELNKRANKLARVIEKHSNRRNQIIGIYLDKSIESVITMLAILKSGNCYLPIDVNYPQNRIDYIIEDSKINILVSSDKTDIQKIRNFDGHILYLDQALMEQEADHNLENVNEEQDLAYIIYTSGTTGNPKGVMVQHKNVIGLMKNTLMNFSFSNQDTWSIFHSFCFDFSVWELYGALLYGGKGVIIKENKAKQTGEFLEILKREQVTVLNQVPSSFYNLIGEELKYEDKALNLKYIIFGGEALQPIKLQRFKEKYNNTKFINMYGITETTVHVTFKEITDLEIKNNRSNIGKPIEGLRIYLLNEKNEEVGFLNKGEICVGGYGVARGYLGKEQLTKERFISNPFCKDEIIYKSGDLAIRLENGEYEYLGRGDSQVKIRGYRIELAEIEKALLQNKNINKAVVLDIENEDGQKDLYGFLAMSHPSKLSEIKEALLKIIPSYMLPSFFIEIDRIPTNHNGKIDREALERQKINFMRDNDFVAARTKVEIQVIQLLKELLKLEQISIYDNFFDIGGDSLKATKLINNIKSHFEKTITFKEIFESKHIAELCDILNEKEVEKEVIESFAEKEYYSVSSAEKRMYISQQYGETNTAYNVITAVRLKGNLNILHLEKSLNAVLNHHENLQSYFTVRDGEIIKKLDRRAQVHLKILYGKEEDILKNKDQIIEEFDLAKAPLFKAVLIKTSEEHHILIMNFHHIIVDGTSLELLLKDIFREYANQSVVPEKMKYVEYSTLETTWLESEQGKREENYWLKQLVPDLGKSEIISDYVRPHTRNFKGKTVNFKIEEKIISNLKSVAKREKLTLYMLLMGLYKVLISKYSNKEEVTLGTAASGRKYKNLENTVGMFVNTLAIQSEPSADKILGHYLKEVKEVCMNAFEYQSYPFDRLVDKLGVQSDPGRNPLFDYLFIFQNEDRVQDFEYVKDLVITRDTTAITADSSRFDISLEVIEENDIFMLQFNYDVNLFKEKTIRGLASHYIHLLSNINFTISKKIKEIELVTSEEQHVLATFNRTEKDIFEYGDTIQAYINKKLEYGGDKSAVYSKGIVYTYNDLDKQANQLGNVLRKKGLTRNDVVAIILERNAKIPLSLLSVLRAGGVCLPIDAELPKERIEYMLRDSKARFVITQKDLMGKIGGWNEDCIVLLDCESAYRQEESTPLHVVNEANDVACIIYTSGTTGNPKGVMLKNNSLINAARYMAEQLNVKNSNVLSVASISFDMFFIEMFIAITLNGELVIADAKERLDNGKLKDLIQKRNVEITLTTPSRIKSFINSEDVEALKGLSRMIFGGENLTENLVGEIRKITNAKIYNFYGPTEITAYCTGTEIKETETVTIGKPVSNTTIYIMSPDLKQLPIGVPGEICVGGIGVAKGYINREELTKSKFVANPYRLEETIYRTGDIGIWTEDGEIKYIGRIDEQVKIRGYRVELEEIEEKIREVEGVTNCVVLALEHANGEKYLSAYVICDINGMEEIQGTLKNKLPEYMIPHFFTKIDEIPVTRNGKVDKRKLQESSPTKELNRTVIKAENNVQEKIIDTWKKILNTNNIGIYDNFFHLGGDSIKAIQLLSALRKQGIHTSTKEILNSPTIDELSQKVKIIERKNERGIFEEVSGNVNFGAIQNFYLNCNQKIHDRFNQSILIHRENGFDEHIVRKVFNTIMKHHDALRIMYQIEDEKYVQFNRKFEEDMFHLETHFYDNANVKEVIKEVGEHIQGKVSIEENKLVSLGVFKGNQGGYLFIAIHHFVVDGVSWRILVEDFETIYESYANNEELKFEPKTVSFKEWVHKIESYSNSNDIMEEVPYWKRIIEQQNLLKIREKKEAVKCIGRTKDIRMTLDKEETEVLLKRTNKKYHTEINDILLTALMLAITENRKENKLIINLEGHGREEMMKGMDVTRTVGWFTSMYPVLLELKENKDISYWIRDIKETLRNVPNKGIGYGVLRYMKKGKTDVLPLNDIEISFNYMGEISSVNEEEYKVLDFERGREISEDVNLDIGIAFNSIIVDNQLKLTITYDVNEYDREFVQELGGRFLQKLRLINSSCKEVEEAKYVPSDLTYSEISIDELDSLEEYINEI